MAHLLIPVLALAVLCSGLVAGGSVCHLDTSDKVSARVCLKQVLGTSKSELSSLIDPLTFGDRDFEHDGFNYNIYSIHLKGASDIGVDSWKKTTDPDRSEMHLFWVWLRFKMYVAGKGHLNGRYLDFSAFPTIRFDYPRFTVITNQIRSADSHLERQENVTEISISLGGNTTYLQHFWQNPSSQNYEELTSYAKDALRTYANQILTAYQSDIEKKLKEALKEWFNKRIFPALRI